MAYDKTGTKREVASLLSRYPKPDRAREAALEEMRGEEARRKMGKRYDEIMPSPEPGESKPKPFAKGGIMKTKKYAGGGKARIMSSPLPQDPGPPTGTFRESDLPPLPSPSPPPPPPPLPPSPMPEMEPRDIPINDPRLRRESRIPGRIQQMYAKGGSTNSASKRADGCAQRGKTRGKFV